MGLLHILIAELKTERLQLLITDQVVESKTIEYKETLSISTRDERKEFLADVSAFANELCPKVVYGRFRQRVVLM